MQSRDDLLQQIRHAVLLQQTHEHVNVLVQVDLPRLQTLGRLSEVRTNHHGKQVRRKISDPVREHSDKVPA